MIYNSTGYKLKKIVNTARAAFSVVSVGYAGVQCLGEIMHVDVTE